MGFDDIRNEIYVISYQLSGKLPLSFIHDITSRRAYSTSFSLTPKTWVKTLKLRNYYLIYYTHPDNWEYPHLFLGIFWHWKRGVAVNI